MSVKKLTKSNIHLNSEFTTLTYHGEELAHQRLEASRSVEALELAQLSSKVHYGNKCGNVPNHAALVASYIYDAAYDTPVAL
jgi:hypothetical protein